jgi:hypothetical protein
VRLSGVDQGHLLDTFRATFDDYWLDPAFEPYDSARVDDVRPLGYQREILDELMAHREVHDRWRNLVVTATGRARRWLRGSTTAGCARRAIAAGVAVGHTQSASPVKSSRHNPARADAAPLVTAAQPASVGPLMAARSELAEEPRLRSELVTPIVGVWS